MSENSRNQEGDFLRLAAEAGVLERKARMSSADATAVAIARADQLARRAEEAAAREAQDFLPFDVERDAFAVDECEVNWRKSQVRTAESRAALSWALSLDAPLPDRQQTMLVEAFEAAVRGEVRMQSIARPYSNLSEPSQ